MLVLSLTVLRQNYLMSIQWLFVFRQHRKDVKNWRKYSDDLILCFLSTLFFHLYLINWNFHNSVRILSSVGKILNSNYMYE